MVYKDENGMGRNSGIPETKTLSGLVLEIFKDSRAQPHTGG